MPEKEEMQTATMNAWDSVEAEGSDEEDDDSMTPNVMDAGLAKWIKETGRTRPKNQTEMTKLYRLVDKWE